jgi:predicted amidohydrolase YtcJ
VGEGPGGEAYVFTNGRVYTVNPAHPWAEAVAVKGKQIVYVGTNEGAKGYVDLNTQVIDLQGKMLLPGFVDGQEHMLVGAWTKRGVNLSPAKNKDEVLKLMAEYAKANPQANVTQGYDWTFGQVGDTPTAKDLDSVVRDRLVALLNGDAHDCWFNTRALEIAGVT